MSKTTQNSTPPKGWVPTPSVQREIAEGKMSLQQAWAQENRLRADMENEAAAAKGEAASEPIVLNNGSGRVVMETFVGDRAFHIQLPTGGVVEIGVENLNEPLRNQPGLQEFFSKNPGSVRISESVMEDGNFVTRTHDIPASLFDKSLSHIFGNELHITESGKKGIAGFRERLSEIPTRNKGWAAGNAALGALFLFSAVQSFRHSVEKNPLDPEAKTNIRWGNMTWGAVNGALGGLSLWNAAELLKGSHLR